MILWLLLSLFRRRMEARHAKVLKKAAAVARDAASHAEIHQAMADRHGARSVQLSRIAASARAMTQPTEAS